MSFTGLLIGICSFLVIGAFHPIVIKAEYYTGTRLWWLFLVAGIACCAGAVLVEPILPAAILALVGFSAFWSIKELFEQKERVEKGWFPMNPKRKSEYRRGNAATAKPDGSRKNP